MRQRKVLAFLLVFALLMSALPVPSQAVQMSLAPGNHVRWIDRIGNLPDYARDFYAWLENNATASGALGNPTVAQNDGAAYFYTLKVLKGSVYVGSGASQSQLQDAVLKDLGDQPQIVTAYAFEVYGAFDRDHPEVFWLTGQTQCGMSMSCSLSPQTGIAEYEMTVMFYLINADFDIRMEQYRDKTVLASAITQRDADIARILAGVPTGASVAEQVRYLNKTLTQANSYNSAVAAGGSAPATAWKCIGALSGSVGTQGPVCEGYARAFKVLCDKLGIPCVLVEGQSKSSASAAVELHMWNQVLVDGSWYAVDVTWNDPTVEGQTSSAISGYETESYLLVGANTPNASGQRFSDSHLLRNCASQNGLQYTNGPILAASAYVFETQDPNPNPDPDPNPDPNPDPDPDPNPDPEPEKPELVLQQMRIDAYRTQVRTAPRMEGYVFLGWFTDEQMKRPLSQDEQTGYAYAAFGDEQLLTVKCQLKEGTDATSSSTDLRLITGVSNAKPRVVVFLIDGVEYGADGLYASLCYGNTAADQIFGAAGTYAATCTITNIPQADFDRTMVITPGWYTMDGTFVTGESRTVCVNDGLQ